LLIKGLANSSLPFKTAESIAIIIIIVLITANLEVLMAAMAIPIGNNTGNNRSSSNVSKMNTTTTTIAGMVLTGQYSVCLNQNNTLW